MKEDDAKFYNCSSIEDSNAALVESWFDKGKMLGERTYYFGTFLHAENTFKVWNNHRNNDLTLELYKKVDNDWKIDTSRFIPQSTDTKENDIHKANDEENELIKQLIKIHQSKKQLEDQLKQKIKDRKYIYNDDHIVTCSEQSDDILFLNKNDVNQWNKCI